MVGGYLNFLLAFIARSSRVCLCPSVLHLGAMLHVERAKTEEKIREYIDGDEEN